MLIEARESVSHQGSSNCLLHLIVASIKSLTSGIRRGRDLDEPMAFVIAIGSEVLGECVVAIRVELGRKVLRMALVCPGFFDFELSASLGLLSGTADGNGARCWRMTEGLLGLWKK